MLGFLMVDHYGLICYTRSVVNHLGANAMSKLFTFAGTCTENNATVYKFANDAKRAKALERFGCTNVNMIELPKPMDKDAAIAYLAQVGMTASKAPRVAKSAKPAKVAKSATVKVTKSKSQARVGKSKTVAADPLGRDEYDRAVLNWEANELPVRSFAEWKRDVAAAQKFFAKAEDKMAKKIAAGKWFKEA
jgi:hypothetical protein